MPRGNPKRPTNLRLDRNVVAEVLEHTDGLTAAIEEGLRLWLQATTGTSIAVDLPPDQLAKLDAWIADPTSPPAWGRDKPPMSRSEAIRTLIEECEAWRRNHPYARPSADAVAYEAYWTTMMMAARTPGEVKAKDRSPTGRPKPNLRIVHNRVPGLYEHHPSRPVEPPQSVKPVTEPIDAPKPQMAPSAPQRPRKAKSRYQLPTSGAHASAPPPPRVRNPVTGKLERVQQ